MLSSDSTACIVRGEAPEEVLLLLLLLLLLFK